MKPGDWYRVPKEWVALANYETSVVTLALEPTRQIETIIYSDGSALLGINTVIRDVPTYLAATLGPYCEGAS